MRSPSACYKRAPLSACSRKVPWLCLLRAPPRWAASLPAPCGGASDREVARLCLARVDLAEPSNLTQNTAGKIPFPTVRDAEGVGSSGRLGSGLRCTSRVCYTLFFNPLLSKLICKGLILFSVASKGRLPSVKVGTTRSLVLVMKAQPRRALCG